MNINKNKLNKEKLIKEYIRIINIANTFLKIPATTGSEIPFLEYLEKIAKKLNYDVFYKKNEYITIKKKDSNPKYLFSAHIDRQGFILNENNKIEYSAFYWKKKRSNEKFKTETDLENLNHFLEKTEKINEIKKEFKFKNLLNEYLLIENLKEPTKNLKLSIPSIQLFEKIAIRYSKENIYSYQLNGKIIKKYKIERYDVDIENKEVTFQLDKKINPKKEKYFFLESKIKKEDNLFYGQIDNVISIATLFYLLEKTDFQEEIILTTGEEYGNSWKNIVDYTNKKENKLKLIVLDTSPYLNFKNKENGFLTLRKGDERGGFDLELFSIIEKITKENKIPTNIKPSSIGNTELGKVALETNNKINGITIQLPTMNYHTTFETSTLESLKNYLIVILKLIQK